MLDTFQAMCKFESVNPGFRFDTDDSRTHYYGPAVMFFIAYAAY